MNEFISFLKDELKQVRSRNFLIAIIIILALALGFLQYGAANYKNLLAKKTTFQDIEVKKINLFYNYRQYASFGFRILFHPDPLSILFTNSSVSQDMVSSIDTSDRLNIDKSLKGSTAFKMGMNWFGDFSGILLFFGTLIALVYGFAALPNRNYQCFLSSITNEKKMFFSILLARAIILAIFFLLIITAAILIINLNGVSLAIDKYLIWFFIKLYGVTLFFLILGSLCGTFKSLIAGLTGAFTTWFLLVFVAPFIVGIIVSYRSDVIKPETQLDIEKLTLLLDFEKRFEEKTGKFELNKVPTDIQKKLVEGFYQNEFQKIQALEEEMRVQMLELAKLYYKLSSFFPTTEYLASISEISSKGYKALDASYRHLIQIKADFFKEYMEKVYFSAQPAKVEPFLKGDDNVFKSKPALPDYFHLGNFFNLLWIAALAMFSFYRYKNNLFELPEKEKDVPEPQDIKIKRGKLKSWHIFSDLLKLQLFNLLSNDTREFKKKGYSFRVFLDDQELNTAKKRQKFLYLCHPKTMPGHVVLGNFLTLVMDLMRTPKDRRKEIISRFSLETAWNKKFSQLKISELGGTFLAILELKQFDIYLIDDIGKNMLLNYCCDLEEKITALQDAESTVLFLTTDVAYVKKEKKQGSFFESSHWVDTIKGIKLSLPAANAEKE